TGPDKDSRRPGASAASCRRRDTVRRDHLRSAWVPGPDGRSIERREDGDAPGGVLRPGWPVADVALWATPAVPGPAKRRSAAILVAPRRDPVLRGDRGYRRRLVRQPTRIS